MCCLGYGLAMATRVATALVLVVAVAGGCGGGGKTPDAGPADAPTTNGSCGTPAGTIASVPGEFTGATVGAGADLAVAEATCLDQRTWVGSNGEDQVVEIDGLTPGTAYVVDLVTDEDLAFYVATGCDAGGPLEMACLLYVDQTVGAERGEFVGPDTGKVSVIVDSANEPAAPATGAYTLRVRAADCVPDTLACTDPGRMICDDYACVACTSAFDCTTSGAPACDGTGTCVAGPDACTGDDAGEPDDGPAAAQVIAAVPPTVPSPTVISAAVCSTGGGEADWYTFTLAAPASIRFELAWADGTADLDFALGDATGIQLETGDTVGAGPEAFVADLDAGTYFISVDKQAPADVAAATPYTLTLSVPECATSFDCAAAAQPVCDVGLCVAGPSDCTGDDAADGGATPDDGPHAARAVVGGVGTPVVMTGSVCDVPDAEADWYSINIAAGQGETINLAFAAGDDFDVEAFDAAGNLLGRSWYLAPEIVTLTYLPAGTIYVAVTHYSGVFGGDPAAGAYTVTFTKTAAQTCTSSADCATEYATQVYRGACNGAAGCAFIPAGTRAEGAACDSGTDCDSGKCSYSRFESDADKSVCTIECAVTDDCAAIPGTTCTDGLVTELCIPSCASDLECGAAQGNASVTPGEPWHYLTCTEATGICSP